MDTFLVEVVVYLMVISVPFAVYMLAMNHQRYKRLLKHQKEWNEIKKSLPNDDQQALYDAFYKYCDKLLAERHPTLGACFPRM